MGGSRWSDAHYAARSAKLVADGKPVFHYDADTKRARAAGDIDKLKVHESFDPKLKAGPKSPFAGRVMRECCDSDAHPESRAVVVLFDVTGSMGGIPRRMQEKLPGLMGLLIGRSYLAHPAILFGAIGDATSDEVPLQIGQFESGDSELHGMFEHMVIESGGGGHITESYELALYFIARHTAIDCFAKRGDRGYLFTIGDEMPYDMVQARFAKSLIDDALQGDIATEQIARELQERYDVYHILPRGASNTGNREIKQKWQSLFGQHVLELDEPENVSELIASTVGIAEGVVDADGALRDLRDGGMAASPSLSTALAVVATAGGTGLRKTGRLEGSLPVAAGAGVTNL